MGDLLRGVEPSREEWMVVAEYASAWFGQRAALRAFMESNLLSGQERARWVEDQKTSIEEAANGLAGALEQAGLVLTDRPGLSRVARERAEMALQALRRAAIRHDVASSLAAAEDLWSVIDPEGKSLPDPEL